MAATLCAKLLPKQGGWLPLIQSVRHGSKAVTRRRKPMHFNKKKLFAVTEYIPPNPGPPPGAYPTQIKRVVEETAYVKLLKRNVQETFQSCKMIAVVQNNCCNSEDMLILRNRLFKHEITIKFFPNQVMRSFLANSVYSNMSPLFIGHTVMIVSKEPKVKEMLSVLRSSPQMTLLGGCVENTLLSVQGLQHFSKLPAMSVVQGQLVSGLTMLTSQTAFMLQRHPAHLSALLQQYVTQQSPDRGSEEAQNSQTSS
ncbi:large ribosomal subunit protein uL10m [Synchiropus picturatus]